MKETVTEYEEIEKEVERVYCDECGNECTDSHRIRPQEVCEGCSSRDHYATMRQFMSAEVDPSDDKHSIYSVLFLTVASPLVVILSILDAISGDGEMGREDALFLLATTFGMVGWAGVALFMIYT